MTEEWREVPGTNGMYEISIDTKEGKCRSLYSIRRRKLKEPRIKSNNVDKNGRIYWNLYVNGKRTNQQAARWIALTYPELIENEYFEGAEIDHINTDRIDNRPCNLRWVTRKENLNNTLTRKHISQAHKGRLLNHPGLSKCVYQYDLQGNYIGSFRSVKEAERQTGIHNQSISNCCLCKRHNKTAGGYIWKYIRF